ncbi:large hypothetical protein [Cryptosporidium canis]|nr:large hypothetical protein [Cryptosporidium canis]
MNIENLCNYDLLQIFEVESNKLWGIFKDNHCRDAARLKTCRRVATIGVEIIDRYFKIFNSIPCSKEAIFDESFNGRITNVLKISRFCLEYVIWKYEDDVEFNGAGKMALLGLLLKILFYQGDLMECSIILERILDGKLCQKVQPKYRYLFELFYYWNLLEAKKIFSPNIVHNHLIGNLLLRELKIRNLFSITTGDELESIDVTNYSGVVEELQHSMVRAYMETNIKVIPKINFKQNLVSLFERIYLRLELSHKFKIKGFDNTHNTIANYYKCLKQSKVDKVEYSFEKKQDNTNTDIFTYLEYTMQLNIADDIDRDVLNPSQYLENYLKGLNEELYSKDFRNEARVITERRTRSRNSNNSGSTPLSLNRETEYYLGHDLESPLKHLIYDILGNTIMPPNCNDKQFKIWFQTIPYSCYNLMQSILGKEELQCGDVFSLNFNSNFLNIEQFDEMINNEAIKIAKELIGATEKSVNYQDLIILLSKLKSDHCINLNKSITVKNENIKFVFTNVMPIINNYLLSAEILLSSILKFIYLKSAKTSQMLIEKLSIIFFNIVEQLFNNYVELVKYTIGLIEFPISNVLTANLNCTYSLNLQDRKYTLIATINRLYNLLFRVAETSRKEILVLLCNVLKNLIVFMFITKSIIYNYKNDRIMKFFDQIKSNFLFLIDIITLAKERDCNILSNIDIFTRKLFIIFNILEIPMVKICLDSELMLVLNDDIVNMKEYYNKIYLILDLSSNLDYKEVDDGSTDYSSILFSNKNINIIKNRFLNWKHILDSKYSSELSLDSVKSYAIFLNNNYLDYLLLKKTITGIKIETANEHFLINLYNSIIYLSLHFSKNVEVLESILNGILIPLMKSLILIMSSDLQYLNFNYLIINKIILSTTNLLLKATELYESKSMSSEFNIEKSFCDMISKSIIINISCIHKVFMNLFSINILNLQFLKNLMNLLIALFDFYKCFGSMIIISSNSVLNLMKYIIYLEFLVESARDENKEIKDIKNYSKMIEFDLHKRHIFNNYCILTSFIENSIKRCEPPDLTSNKIIPNREFDFFYSIKNTKILLLSMAIKFGLFLNFTNVESWFREIYVFVQKYKTNKHFIHWNSLFLQCQQFVEKYLNIYKFFNVKVLQNKKSNLYTSLPEHETEFLELLGILLQLLYGIPVCPLPSSPFNKMPTFNQASIYDDLFAINKTILSPTNLKEIFNDWLISKIIENRDNQKGEIFEYLSPYSPLLALCCNIFQMLINCTSLTEKQYSDSSVKFYTSIIGLIEKLFFNGKSLNDLDDSIWNFIGSPLFYPSFMNDLDIDNKKKMYFDIYTRNTTDGLSSLLYNSKVSDQILNYYDNIMVVSPSTYYLEINNSGKTHSNINEELLDTISVYHGANNLAIVSIEPYLYCKFYYANLLDEFMKSSMDSKLLDNRLDQLLFQFKGNNGFISFSEDKVLIQFNRKDHLKRYIPFNFLNDCFISCIPASYKDRSSNLWSPIKFGITGSNMQLTLNTLFKYLKWLNMNLFLVGNCDLKLITCGISVLKQMICELDDYDALENTMENKYPIVLSRIVAQAIYLLECEIKLYKKLTVPQMKAHIRVKNILSTAFDQIIIRFIHIKGVYKKVNTKYLLMYLNQGISLSKLGNGYIVVPRNLDEGLLLNAIKVSSEIRTSIFTELVPTLFSENKDWCSIYSNSFQSHCCIWLPSFIESKTRFKLAKLLISSFFKDFSDHYLIKAAFQLKNAYYLSVESLVICYLIVTGNTEEINLLSEIYKNKTSKDKELMNYFKSKILDIYGVLLNTYLNKLPEGNPLNSKLKCTKNPVNISYSNFSPNIACILFYFYKSFSNLQSIKQFIIILIKNSYIALSKNEVLELKSLVVINSDSLDHCGIKEMINELIFDELDSSQTALKKNRLTQSLLTPVINHSFSHFSLMNFILLKESTKLLMNYYQKYFLANKKIIGFCGFEHNKVIVDHYTGLYLRRSRKCILYKYKFMFASSLMVIVIRNDIVPNINDIILLCASSKVDQYAYYNLNGHLNNCSSFIFFSVYSTLIGKENNYRNIGEITYYYLDSLNKILDNLIDLLISEFKTIRQLPAIESFEHTINDQIKNGGKKGVNTNFIDFGTVNWSDVSESGLYNISWSIIEKVLNEIIGILEFVDNISLPIDGRLLSNLFGLVILFHKHEVMHHNNDSQINKFTQYIPLNVIKQLERVLGNFVSINIPFSVQSKIGKFKLSLETAFINIINKSFTFSIDYRIDLSKSYLFEVIYLLIQFFGISFNGVNSSNRICTGFRGAENILLDEMRSASKRLRRDISLFD